ncbi:MAG: hypothetical protein LBC98_01535 [Prevotellaceae bacterium]|jgi:shikimate dehydrogenase|nr:hypothetical protein [Prevotellaceae bacterium]
MRAKRFTIVGNPVSHSVSPELFRSAYPMNLELTYDRNATETALEAMAVFKSGYSGGNVTAPFKMDILNLVDEVLDDASEIGAANTITISPKGIIIASNTDHIGVSDSLNEHGVSVRNKPCLVLGAGGAGKAAAYALSQMGASLTVANRSKEKVDDFVKKIGGKLAGLTEADEFEKLVRESEIIINTVYPSVDIVPSEWLNKKQVVFDASYIGSALTKKAAQCGCRIIDGRYWVFHQALHSYVRLSGIRPDEQSMRRFIGI